MRAFRIGLAASVLFWACGGGDVNEPARAPADTPQKPDASATTDPDPVGRDSGLLTKEPLELQLVFVHGVLSEDDQRRRAEGALADLERSVSAAVEARRPSFEATAARSLRVTTARVNLYTDENGALLDPRIDDRADGTGLPTANAWRAQLAKKTNLALGADARNIVFIGHSTGARASAEVAAGVGDDALPGTHDWGLGGRVAGVVTIHGMIDALDSSAYDFVGPTSFVVGCRAGQGSGWCEYAGKISGVAALDWVAQQRHVLSLIGAGSCSPSLWTGVNDKSLPLAAQSSPWSPGMTMTPASGQTFVPAHGTFYGEYCHSDITDGGSPRHELSVSHASERIVAWLFDAAPRVAGARDPGTPFTFAPVAAGELTPSADVTGPCGSNRRESGEPEVVGVCVHPGSFDGDDHAFDATTDLETTRDGACGGSTRFTHRHAGEEHASRLWMKVYSVPLSGGVLTTLR